MAEKVGMGFGRTSIGRRSGPPVDQIGVKGSVVDATFGGSTREPLEMALIARSDG
jgi:hypothetical protein